MSSSAKDYPAELVRMAPVAAPSKDQAKLAVIAKALKAEDRAKYKLVGPDGESVRIPESLFHMLSHIAKVMARGDAVTIVPVDKELTTQKAADILNVSRQYLVRLLDEGKLPFTKTGAHRRIRIQDVIAYKLEREQSRREGLRELSRLSQEFGGYEELESK